LDSSRPNQGRTQAIKENRGRWIGTNDLVETQHVYCALLEEDGVTVSGYASLELSRGKMLQCRSWLARITERAPIFMNRARVRTMAVRSRLGNTHYLFEIIPFRVTWEASRIIPSTERGLLLETQRVRELFGVA